MTNTNLASLFLILIIALSLGAMPTFTADVEEDLTDDENLEKTERLLKILEKSETQVKKILERMEREGIPIPEASREKFEEGLSLVQEAIQLRDQADYGEADEKAVDAMEEFEEALKIAGEEAPPETSDIEAAAEKAIGLKRAIERAYNFADKVEALANKAQGDVTTIRENIKEAKNHLKNAEAFQRAGEPDEAARELARARGILGRSMGEVHKISKGFKGKKAENFLKQTEKRLSKLEEKNEKLLQNVPPQEKAKVTDAIQDARDSIQEIRRKIEAGDVDEAVEDLVELKNYLKSVHKMLNSIKRNYRKSLGETEEEEELQ